jgi:hypothetical protein
MDGTPKQLKAPEPLPIPLNASHIQHLLDAIEDTRKEERVFPYCNKTGYNIIRRAWKYPHLFRLTRITKFIEMGYRISDIKSWTSLRADIMTLTLAL